MEELLYDKRDGIGFITLNRPQARNAMTFPMYERLAEICSTADQDAELKVLVITGAGEKAFVAGADINEFAGRTALQQREVMKSGSGFGAADNFTKPLIAMVNGFCLGGGCELAMGSSGDAGCGVPCSLTNGVGVGGLALRTSSPRR